MMKIKKYIVLIIMLLLIMLSSNIYAATTGSFSVTSQKSELDIGGTTTVTITVKNCEGQFTIASSDNSILSIDSTSKWVDGTATITVTAKKAGTAKITVTASDVADNQTEPEDVTGLKSVAITVKEPVKEEPTPTPTPTPTPEPTPTPTPEPEPTPQKPKEPTFKNVNETVYVNQETVNVRGTWSASGGQYGSLKKGDSVTRTGISSETINGYVWSRINYNGKTAYVISSALTTTKVEVPEEEEDKKEDEEKSTNKALKELKVEGYDLTPEFNAETTKYSLVLNETDETTEKLEITATPEDEKSKVSITGNENFKVGNNIVKITVIAEDGTARIYTITVTKNNEEIVVDSLKLDTLQVSNGILEPEFSPDITNYIITVEDPTTLTVESILATVSDKNITITKSETTPDENGEKIITLMLESQKDEKTGIYQFTVKKPAPVQTTQQTKLTNSTDNTIYYILGGIIGGLVLLIIIIIVALKKTSNNEEDIKDADELTDDYDYNLKGAIDEANKSYDDMVKESNVKSQILNSDFKVEDETKVMDKFDFDDNENDEFKYNEAPKKKGKHF